MTRCIDNLLCKFYIKLYGYDIYISTDMLCMILWMSPHAWDAPVSGYMEVIKLWTLNSLHTQGRW